MEGNYEKEINARNVNDLYARIAVRARCVRQHEQT